VGNKTTMDDDIEDLYVFTLQSGDLKIKLLDTSADLDMFLLSIEGVSTTIRGSNTRGAAVDEIYESSDLEPGEYYLGVAIYDDHPLNPVSTYTLTIEGDLFINLGAQEIKAREREGLQQNFPNPFSRYTTVNFTVADPGLVRINVRDAAGRLVRTLADSRYLPGDHSVSWDGLDQAGGAVAPGMYHISMESPAGTEIIKALLLK